MSVLPSPVKSAGTALSVVDPNVNAGTWLSDERWYHHDPFDGRQTETSVLLSPSKSNGARRVGPPAVTEKFTSAISKKMFPTASTLMRAEFVTTLGIVTDSLPSFA